MCHQEEMVLICLWWSHEDVGLGGQNPFFGKGLGSGFRGNRTFVEAQLFAILPKPAISTLKLVFSPLL